MANVRIDIQKMFDEDKVRNNDFIIFSHATVNAEQILKTF